MIFTNSKNGRSVLKVKKTNFHLLKKKRNQFKNLKNNVFFTIFIYLKKMKISKKHKSHFSK